MYRDFSEKSKIALLGMVSQVENEKISEFTDWIGDRWYDFESWIGKLDLRNYINNVNSYHKKVIDKNNATKESINTIFSKVESLDTAYRGFFLNKKSELQQWQRYIQELSQIVNPGNGSFHTKDMESRLADGSIQAQSENFENVRKYLTEILNKDTEGLINLFRFLLGSPTSSTGSTGCLVLRVLMKNRSDNQQDNQIFNDDNSIVKDGLTFLSGLNKSIGKYGNQEGVTLSSSILSYLGALYSFADSSHEFDINATSNMLSLFKSSVGVEEGIYKYYEKKLHPYEVLKLDARFGKTMTGISILSSVAGTANTSIETYKVFSDPNSTVYDKAAQSTEMLGAGFDLGGKVYITQHASTKTLQVINSASGSSKAINQILANKQELKFTTSSAATSSISKVNTVLAVGGVATSTISGAIKQYGKVTEDGKFDMGDAGSVGVYASLGGLDKVCSGLTFGLVSFDGEKVAADLENEVDDFVKGNSWAAQYIRDENNDVLSRFGVSVGSGIYLLGKEVASGVANGVKAVADAGKTVGSWISTGWNAMTNSFY